MADNFNISDQGAGVTGPSVQLGWKFDDDTTIADPGANNFRYDNATPASITQIAVNDETLSGADASTLLNALDSGDDIYIQQTTDGATFALFNVTSVTDNGGWFTIDVTPVSTGTLPEDGKECGWILLYGSGGGAAGVTSFNTRTGAVVSVASDYDASQVDNDSAVSGAFVDDALNNLLNEVAQARRTTDYVTTTAFADVDLDTTDVETDSGVVDHDAGTNDDNIIAVVAGTYEVHYHFDIDPSTVGDTTAEIQSRVRVNDTTVIPGSEAQTTVFEDGSIEGDDFSNQIACTFVVTLAASDFVTLQVNRVDVGLSPAVDLRGGSIVMAMKRLTD